MHMFKTMADVKRANKAGGGHFFDRETVRFFNGRVEGGPYAGRYFVDSSQFIDANRGVSDPRRYHVREVRPDGRIDLVSTHATKAEAIAAAKGNKVNPRKNSGKAVYVLTAGSRGAPRGYIGTFATKDEAEAARLRERGPAYIKREIVRRNPSTNTGVVDRRKNPRKNPDAWGRSGTEKHRVPVGDVLHRHASPVDRVFRYSTPGVGYGRELPPVWRTADADAMLAEASKVTGIKKSDIYVEHEGRALVVGYRDNRDAAFHRQMTAQMASLLRAAGFKAKVSDGEVIVSDPHPVKK